MLKWFLILVLMALASCQSLALSHAPDENPTPSKTPVTTWMETEVNGVRLGMQMPQGWAAADRRDGLMFAEATENGELEVGMAVYVFVPPLDHFHTPEDAYENTALVVLEQVVAEPSLIGHSAVASSPVAFTWNGHDAAYYLLSNEDAVKTIVLAVEASAHDQLVVCNISMPASQADRAREMLPVILDGLMIDDERMDGDALEVLPNPLEFPEISVNPEATPPVVQ